MANILLGIMTVTYVTVAAIALMGTVLRLDLEARINIHETATKRQKL